MRSESTMPSSTRLCRTSFTDMDAVCVCVELSHYILYRGENVSQDMHFFT